MTQLKRLEAICNFDKTGDSQWISIEQLDSDVFKRKSSNGRQYSFIRSSGEYDYRFDNKPCKFIQIFKTENALKQAVPSKVRKVLKGLPCVFTGISGTTTEIDHKVGRPEDGRIHLVNTEMFQPLHSSVNYKKREYCNKVCSVTNKRFDARTLGYRKGWYKGGKEFEGTCTGCMYFDISEFRRNL